MEALHIRFDRGKRLEGQSDIAVCREAVWHRRFAAAHGALVSHRSGTWVGEPARRCRAAGASAPCRP
jgi:hypothetical protein